MIQHSKKPAPGERGGPSECVLLGGERTEYSHACRLAQASRLLTGRGDA